MKRSFHVDAPLDIISYPYNKRLKGENGEGFFPPWTSSNSMESLSIQDQEKIGSLNTVYHNGETYEENKFVDCYESEGHIVEELKCDSSLEDRDLPLDNSTLRDLYHERERRKSQKNSDLNKIQSNLSLKSENNYKNEKLSDNMSISLDFSPTTVQELSPHSNSHYRQQLKFQRDYEERQSREENDIEIEKNDNKNSFDLCEQTDISFSHACKGFRYQNIDQILPLLSLNENLGSAVNMDMNDMEVDG